MNDKAKLTKLVSQLDDEDLPKVLVYVESLLEVDKEMLNLKEEQALKLVGFNPSNTIPDWEWEQMQKRNKLSLDMEGNKNDTSRK